MKLKITLLLGLAIFLFVVFILGLGFIIFGGRYFAAWQIRLKLQQIPGVKVVEIRPTDGDYSISVIDVRNKGQMGFGGWSLKPEQFDRNNIYPIGLSGIGGCKIEVVQDVGYRGWVQLNKEEIGFDVPTVKDAIDKYDSILAEVKSWKPIPYGVGRQQGRFADCK